LLIAVSNPAATARCYSPPLPLLPLPLLLLPLLLLPLPMLLLPLPMLLLPLPLLPPPLLFCASCAAQLHSWDLYIRCQQWLLTVCRDAALSCTANKCTPFAAC
jgi:hypothetical protein